MSPAPDNGPMLTVKAAANARARRMVENAFGTDQSVWRDASPVNHLSDAKRLAPFQVVVRGSAGRRATETAFARALRAVGGDADVIEASTLSHGDVNRLIGAPGDTVMTPKVEAFLMSCLPPS